MRDIRANNLDLLRLAAATAVVLCHAIELSDHGVKDPLLALTGTVSLGSAAVWVFFCVSGFLVSESWRRDPRVLPYAMRRLLRVGPGLLAAVALALFVFGPVFSSLGPTDYFYSGASWRYAETSLLFPQQYTLPGVFTGNHWGADVNGCLWTLRYELLCYLVVPVVLGVGRRLADSRVIAVAMLTTSLVVTMSIPPGYGVPLPGQLELRTLAEMLAFFQAGVVLRVWLDHVPMRWDAASVAAGLAVIGFAWRPAFVVLPVALAYTSVFIGTATRARRIPLLGSADLSYGVYVYGFIIEQSVISLMGGSAPAAAVFLIALPITLLVAAGSWRCIERPALTLKRRLVRDSAPPAVGGVEPICAIAASQPA